MPAGFEGDWTMSPLAHAYFKKEHRTVSDGILLLSTNFVTWLS
jgi:hypothetical protein